MDISVLMATYKRVKILAKTLESLTLLDTNGLNWEILAVDNAGDKASKDLIEGFKEKLPIAYLIEKRQGKNNALNYALTFAKGELLIFTDDDIIADKNWLREIWDGSRRWPDYDIFGGRILPRWPSEKQPLVNMHNNFFRSAYTIVDWDASEQPYRPESAWGPNMAIRKRVFQHSWKYNPEVGPSGENYIMGSETELLVRLKEAGFKAIYLPKAVVFHQIREEQLTPRWLYKRAFRSGRASVFCYKHPDVPTLFGYPRYLVRKLLELSVKRFFTIFDIDKSKKIDLGMQYEFIKGKMYQYRDKGRVK